MKHLSDEDQRLVSRLVDGELVGEELANLERRLLQERPLREAVEEQRESREWFGRVRDERDPVVPPDFSDRVLAGVRDLPERSVLLHEAAVPGEIEREREGAIVTARALLVAAVLILSLSLAVSGGLMTRSDSGVLEAADSKLVDEIQAEIEEADRRRVSEQRSR